MKVIFVVCIIIYGNVMKIYEDFLMFDEECFGGSNVRSVMIG